MFARGKNRDRLPARAVARRATAAEPAGTGTGDLLDGPAAGRSPGGEQGGEPPRAAAGCGHGRGQLARGRTEGGRSQSPAGAKRPPEAVGRGARPGDAHERPRRQGHTQFARSRLSVSGVAYATERGGAKRSQKRRAYACLPPTKFPRRDAGVAERLEAAEPPRGDRPGAALPRERGQDAPPPRANARGGERAGPERARKDRASGRRGAGPGTAAGDAPPREPGGGVPRCSRLRGTLRTEAGTPGPPRVPEASEPATSETSDSVRIERPPPTGGRRAFRPVVAMSPRTVRDNAPMNRGRRLYLSGPHRLGAAVPSVPGRQWVLVLCELLHR